MDEFKSYKVALIRGSHFDLSLIDFSCFGFNCENINSEKIRAFFKENCLKEDTPYDTFSDFMKQLDDLYDKASGTEEYYAIYAENKNSFCTESEIRMPFNALLSAFPSGLHFSHLFDFQEREEAIWAPSISIWYPEDWEQFWNNKLVSSKSSLESISRYLSQYKDKHREHRYIDIANNY